MTGPSWQHLAQTLALNAGRRINVFDIPATENHRR